MCKGKGHGFSTKFVPEPGGVEDFSEPKNIVVPFEYLSGGGVPLPLLPVEDAAYMVVGLLYAEGSSAPYAVVGLGDAPLRTLSEGVNRE